MKIFLLLFLLIFTKPGIAQPCDTNALIIDQVRAADTDANIPFELVRHYTFYNPMCAPKNTLLVHLVGSYASPYQSVMFPKLAANYGFHVLSLKYQNDVSAQSACGNSGDIDCHYKFRREIIEGEDVSSEIQVDSVNSIQNRLIRLLQYMDANNPTQNWGQYYTADSIHWNSLMLSGHSQGGGHAAVMAIDRPVERVIMFAAPNDFSNNFSQVASWTNLPHDTPDSAYFNFNNVNDQVVDYDWQFGAAQNLGVPGDTTNVEANNCPFNASHNLFTAINLSGFGNNHGSVVFDSSVPVDGDGISIFEEVWLYLLGESCLPLGLEEKKKRFKIYPNPASSWIRVQMNTKGEAYEIRNAQGKIVKKGNLTSWQVDVSNLSEGMYQLIVTSDAQLFRTQFVKN